VSSSVPELTPIEARYLDKAQQTQESLWSALIAAESFLLAVAPLVGLLGPQNARSASIFLAVLSVLSVALLIWNFVSTRNQYFKIGQTITQRRAPSADDISASGRLHDQVRLRERLALILIALQLCLVLAIAIMVANR
jgi:Na+/melibiose symporter-like transporter